MQIEIVDLFYLYEKDGEKVVALRGMHLSVESGECLVVKGPNGSGKSTLVRLLSGFLLPSAGRILIDGEDISKIDPLRLRRELVSSIDQKGNLLPDLTVRENIALAFSLVGFSRKDSLDRAAQLLMDHQLAHLLEAQTSQLSSGERQVCALLTALAGSPKILIADEPSGELDNEAAEKVYQLLRSYAGKTTILLVTHDSRAEIYADRIVRIRDGRISAEWLPNTDEESVVDPFGWMQVVQPKPVGTIRKLNQKSRDDAYEGAVVAVEDISLTFGSRDIFTNFSLEARAGDFIAITGSSGTGKSSILRIMCGIQDATSGGARIHGMEISKLSREARAKLRRDSVSFLAQGDGPIDHLTFREYFGDFTASYLENFHSRKDRRLSGFSGGERARIEIYKMLSQNRKVLMFDEPTSQLDEKHSIEIAELLADHVEVGGIVITSTRDESLLSCATKIISLDIT